MKKRGRDEGGGAVRVAFTGVKNTRSGPSVKHVVPSNEFVALDLSGVSPVGAEFARKVRFSDVCRSWPYGEGRGLVAVEELNTLLTECHAVVADNWSQGSTVVVVCNRGINRSRLAAHLLVRLFADRGTEVVMHNSSLPENDDFAKLCAVIKGAPHGKVQECLMSELHGWQASWRSA